MLTVVFGFSVGLLVGSLLIGSGVLLFGSLLAGMFITEAARKSRTAAAEVLLVADLFVGSRIAGKLFVGRGYVRRGYEIAAGSSFIDAGVSLVGEEGTAAGVVPICIAAVLLIGAGFVSDHARCSTTATIGASILFVEDSTAPSIVIPLTHDFGFL